MDAVLLADALDGGPALPGGGAVGGDEFLDRRVHGVGGLGEAGGDGVQEGGGDVRPGQFAVELRAVEVVRADQVGAQHGAGDQAGDGGVEAGGGDEVVLPGAVGPYAGARVGEDGDLGVEPGDAFRLLELRDRLGQFAGDGALAGPAVDEHHVPGVVVGGQPAQRVGVDAPAAHDRHRVVRQVQAVPELRPAPHQHSDGRTGAGQGDQYRAGRPLGEDGFRHDADGVGEPAGGLLERRVEQRLVLLVGLVLHRQRLRVVRAAALDRLLAFLGRRLERDVREVLQQPADLVGRV